MKYSNVVKTTWFLTYRASYQPVMRYKIMNKLSPECLWDKFELRWAHSKYATRGCHDLQIPRLNTEHAKKGFKYSALKLWNDTPVETREASTLNCFKKKLKAHLLAKQKR